VTPVVDRLLLGVGLAHALVGIACFARLWAGATPIFGVHPALKPLKFAASIAAFLVTMAVLVPSLSVSGRTRDLLSWALSLSTIVEMAAIGTQALRGRRSHFNFEHPLDAAFAMAMLLGILTPLVTMSAITLLATALPLRRGLGVRHGKPRSPHEASSRRCTASTRSGCGRGVAASPEAALTRSAS